MTAATSIDGALAVCRALAQLGARHVFGLPGSQNTAFYEAMRSTGLTAIVPTHELAAAFMAGAYARVSGRPGILTSIPGPGLAYTLAGLAEARLDSAPVLYIVNASRADAMVGFGPQAIDQRALLAPVTKAMLPLARAEDAPAVVGAAWRLALSGEPGPVAIELTAATTVSTVPPAIWGDRAPRSSAPDAAAIAAAVRALQAARRPVLLAGQGALASATEVQQLAARLNAPVLTTPSARGIVPEQSPLAMGFDVLRGTTDAVNRLIEAADLVLALGAKLAHNGSAGGRLVLPCDKLVRVDQSTEAMASVYPAAYAVCADVAAFLADPGVAALGCSAWTADELADHRRNIRSPSHQSEPAICGQPPQDFFAAFGRALAPSSRLVTDTGLHQVMARRHLDFGLPGSLLMPSDFQSMGFGLPAAIAARLADPSRPVVALIGDGGFRMTGFELATAAQAGVSLTVVVLNDGGLNQIRQQQLAEYGITSGTELGHLDLLAFADAIGVAYGFVEGAADLTHLLAAAETRGGITLLEVPVADTLAIRRSALAARTKRLARRAVGGGMIDTLKRLGKR